MIKSNQKLVTLCEQKSSCIKCKQLTKVNPENDGKITVEFEVKESDYDHLEVRESELLCEDGILASVLISKLSFESLVAVGCDLHRAR